MAARHARTTAPTSGPGARPRRRAPDRPRPGQVRNQIHPARRFQPVEQVLGTALHRKTQRSDTIRTRDGPESGPDPPVALAVEPDHPSAQHLKQWSVSLERRRSGPCVAKHRVSDRVATTRQPRRPKHAHRVSARRGTEQPPRNRELGVGAIVWDSVAEIDHIYRASSHHRTEHSVAPARQAGPAIVWVQLWRVVMMPAV